MVPGAQDTVLFNDSIYYNIAYGRENVEATEAEVHEAGAVLRTNPRSTMNILLLRASV